MGFDSLQLLSDVVSPRVFYIIYKFLIMKVKTSDATGTLMVLGSVIFIVGLFSLSIELILAGAGIFIVGYLREQQIKKQ